MWRPNLSKIYGWRLFYEPLAVMLVLIFAFSWTLFFPQTQRQLITVPILFILLFLGIAARLLWILRYSANKPRKIDLIGLPLLLLILITELCLAMSSDRPAAISLPW